MLKTHIAKGGKIVLALEEQTGDDASHLLFLSVTEYNAYRFNDNANVSLNYVDVAALSLFLQEWLAKNHTTA